MTHGKEIFSEIVEKARRANRAYGDLSESLALFESYVIALDQCQEI
jgi:hypothetical protein